MSNRKNILITYASGFGSTAEVAEQIGKNLAEQGLQVKVLLPSKIENLDQFDAVIIGSPIRYDRWMPEARSFVMNNQEQLSKLPVAYFFCCLALAKQNGDTEIKGQQYADKLTRLSPLVKPISIGRFAGVLDFRKMSLPMRLVFKLFSMIVGIKEGDYRDWNDIRQWSKSVAEKL